ncbi:lipopolysaccharide heptosyltransferase RfaC [Testudinibacter sp. TR-2022]|uniref:lipopolysaccharide heptosyltransferase RfaC n=1 Tax=Testudinibacter sp. TR-2022 TaxID=2585029 RepID=UPI00111922CF|nr:lipopolysaccharide heptosyltransferase RfaC [Testudinibacter sp. TR-2022]TNH07249.1 lipopolysaccharide heptosyltransferase RfaC [Pasteurellaceae bacterium Phil11]TNH21119.1 lipopolysaccharide heptosyltransferase RfaC [Testudinibacter sp. TR-2022]TNH27786.1 lipopolysaccharide heptosyltransferase RfaC [Testudinibacter sp. TR-2022]
MKICLIKTSSMGDILHTLPALTDAQRAVADLQLDWVVEESFAEIPTWHLAVNQVIPIALRRWRKTPFSAQTRREWQRYRTLLQQQQYDAVIDAQGLVKSAVFATRLAHGVKLGYDRRSIREPLASFFYDKTHSISYQQHAVERIRQLFALSLGYALPSEQGDYGIARHFLNPANHTTPYLIFIHSTTRDDKHWSESAWRELISALAPSGYQIQLPWGNDKERLRAERLAQGFAYVQVLPKTTLSQIATKIAHAAAVVSVDTGLAHLTAALDKPNITLYGASDPKLIGGYGKNQIALCADSMSAIGASLVLEELLKLL